MNTFLWLKKNQKQKEKNKCINLYFICHRFRYPEKGKIMEHTSIISKRT